MSKSSLAALCISALVGFLDLAFAQKADTVRVGSTALRAADLRLETDIVDSYQLKDGVRTPTRTTVRSITRQRLGNEDVYVMRTVHSVPKGDSSVSVAVVRANDFSLVHHSVKAIHDSASVTASRSYLTAWVVLPNRPIILVDRVLAQPVFPVEGQIPWLLPMLPLASGYHAVVSHFSQWDEKEVWNSIKVVGSENITVGSQTYDCWKVDTGPLGPPGYSMYRWIDKISRRVIQSVLRGQAGGPEYWAVLRP